MEEHTAVAQGTKVMLHAEFIKKVPLIEKSFYCIASQLFMPLLSESDVSFRLSNKSLHLYYFYPLQIQFL